MDKQNKMQSLKDISAQRIIDNPAEEKKAALEIFSSSLVDFFEASSKVVLDIIEDYNSILIILISNDQQFKKDLERALYKNLEKLTHKEFILDGKTHSPSIRNWLKDFIKQHGTGMFDNVVLSRYITDSHNAKILDEEEKNLLRKLLQLYRNLKFFPDSLKSVPVEQWEIIPIERVKEEMTKARTVSGPPKTEEEKKVEELKKVAEQYPEGSLERKAVEEEIMRLGN